MNSIYEARKKLNLTQQEVADAADISRCFYNLIEKQNRKPSLMVAIRLSKILKVCVEDLFQEKENLDV